MFRVTRPAIAGALLLATLAACKRERGGYAGGTIDTTRLAVSPDSAPLAPMAGPMSNNWSGPTIIGFVTTANDAEIQLGMLGEQKASDSRVKAFGRQMAADHKAMKDDLHELATKLGVTLDTGADATRDLAEDMREKLKELNAKAAGKDWDEEYMETAVDGHEGVLKHLQVAAERANAGELRTALDHAIAKVRTHLSQARDLKDKID